MVTTVAEHLLLSKQQLVDLAPGNQVFQAGGVVIDDDFLVPDIATDLKLSLPSIETFVLSGADCSITPTGINDDLNAAWLPVVTALANAMTRWLDDNGVPRTGDAYITASITPANEVNGEAHFDDDQFMANDGVGVVAIAADRQGPRAAAVPVTFPVVQAPRPLTVNDAMKQAFADGTIPHVAFDPNTVVVFPQFGQLHSGPGPCGNADEVRHLLVFRSATVPNSF